MDSQADYCVARYLQYLISTRIQHLERIRTFTTRRLTRIPESTLEEKAAFRRSFSFLDSAILEASATLSFADGLSCVGYLPCAALWVNLLDARLNLIVLAILVLSSPKACPSPLSRSPLQHT